MSFPAASTVASREGRADAVFSGGPILTMDVDRPRVEAVAVRDGRVVATGSAADVQTLVGPGTELVDLQGRALLPGFVDPHMHSAMVQLADWGRPEPDGAGDHRRRPCRAA